MRAVDIIAGKRDGRELGREEIEFLIGGYVAGKFRTIRFLPGPWLYFSGG